MTEDMDLSVGKILEKVKELGIEDNTYIIYMSNLYYLCYRMKIFDIMNLAVRFSLK